MDEDIEAFNRDRLMMLTDMSGITGNVRELKQMLNKDGIFLSADLEPYGDHFEHLRDLADWALLTSREDGSTRMEEAAIRIRERVGMTEIFLPVEYIIRVFHLDEVGRRVIYALAARASLEASLHDNYTVGSLFADYKLASIDCKNALENYLLEKVEQGTEPDFRKRIKSFIFTPQDPLNRYWLHFHVPGESDLIPFQRTYEALRNLTVDSLRPENKKKHMIWLYGKPGAGRKTHIKLLCDELRLSVMFADMGKIAELEDLDRVIDEIVLESLLTGCFICFDNIDNFFETAKGHTAKFFFDIIKAASGLCFATARAEPEGLNQDDYIIATVETPPPNYNESVKLWSYFCADRTFEEGFDIHSAAERFLLSPRQIKNCVEDAQNMSVSLGKGAICGGHIFERCRKYSAPALSNMGRLISPVFTWDDLILPESQKSLLKSALNRARYRKKVYSDWSFASKAPYGNGLAILLSGQSGTGKTMTAQVFAGELSLAIYKIDLPMVVSKYIGETEKNLKEIFDEAKAGNYVLFFDEADSLFGKRTEIKDSHDRNANMEVSYLLQRLEEYEGVTILATNIVKNFDEAFKRRFQFIIDFPFPDMENRKTIWKKVFPSASPLDSDIDYDFLSTFMLTGSAIKSCALTAAFIAASGDEVIGMPQIIQALHMENDKCGLGLVIEDFGM